MLGAAQEQLRFSPTVYQNEEDRTIQIVFTAAGPMYDYEVAANNSINSRIVIGIPPGLGTAPGTATDSFPAPAAQTEAPSGDEFITVSRVTGSVQFRGSEQQDCSH